MVELDFTIKESAQYLLELQSDEEPIELGFVEQVVVVQKNIEEILTGIINGVNKIFTTSNNFMANSTEVFRNGLKQTKNNSYHESGANEITFSEAPTAEGFIDELTIKYIKE